MPRGSFLPILFRFAARMERMSWEEFSSDPINTLMAIRNAQTAFGSALVLNWFDTWAECETLGASVTRDSDGNPLSSPGAITQTSDLLSHLTSGLLPRLKEVASRQRAERAAGTLTGGFVTGPATLAAQLGGSIEPTEAAVVALQWTIEMIRAYGEIGMDLFVVGEDATRTAAFYSDHAQALQPLLNLLRYYRRPLMILSRIPLDECEISNATLGGLRCVSEPAHLLLIGAGRKLERFRIIPEALFMAPREQWNEHLEAIARDAVANRDALISSWEVPPATEPERLLELRARLAGARDERQA
jgi:hypothetical protein